MVHAMPTDPRATPRVAWLVTRAAIAAVALAALAACRPVVRPDAPGSEPDPVTRLDRPRPAVTGGNQLMVGELCPQAAAGRAAIAPLMMRTTSWVDAAGELSAVVERGGVPRFAVYGVDGKRAGVFDTMGLADIGLPQPVASGTYVGGAPCSADAGTGPRTPDARCTAATNGCGLAVGELGRPDDPPDTLALHTGGACLSGDALAVDIDGDGVVESFPLVGVLDGVRSPATEWTAAPLAGAACTPAFAVYDLRIVPAPEGKPLEAKHAVGLDVLGVLDLDGDGRRELVLALRFPTVRTVVVYTSTAGGRRLELAAEGQSFPR